MASRITSKYLQLPDCDTSNKPSPLALLVATCQRIGSSSPTRPSSPAAQPRPTREKSPVVEARPSEKVAAARSPTTRPTSISPATESTMLPAASPSSLPSPTPRSPSYQLPLTPPTTPPQTDTCAVTASPLRQSPIQVVKYHESMPSELNRLTEHSQHHFPYYPVLHAPGLGLSPYPVVVPSASPLSSYHGACLSQCCAHVSSVPPPLYYPHPLLALTPATLPPPVLPFGVYHHHQHDIIDQTCGKIRYHHNHHHHRLHKTPYSRSTALKEREEDFIDVVTV